MGVKTEKGDRAERKLIQMMTLMQGNGVGGKKKEGIRESDRPRRASKPRRRCGVIVNWKRWR